MPAEFRPSPAGFVVAPTPMITPGSTLTMEPPTVLPHLPSPGKPVRSRNNWGQPKS